MSATCGSRESWTEYRQKFDWKYFIRHVHVTWYWWGGSGLHSWGLPFTHSPFNVPCNWSFLDLESFFYGCVFFGSCNPFFLPPSCLVICFCCTRCSTFSPPWTWSSDTVASVVGRSWDWSQSAVFMLCSKKNSYGGNICIPFLWFEGKRLQCFFTSFLIGGMRKKARLKFWLGVSCMATCLHQAPRASPERVVLLLLYLLHENHSSTFLL